MRWSPLQLRRLLAGLMLLLGTATASRAELPHHGFAPPSGIGGPIDLLDQNGAPFSLARLAGKPALVFFGLVRCGTTCPVALVTAQQVLAAFAPPESPPVVFVTLDPLSDSPRELGSFLARIDTRLIGLSGDPISVERAAERYGVGVRARENGVDHSSMWYLLDRAGQLRRVYPHTTPVAHLVADLQALQAPPSRNK
jgi:protein SCO1/2